MTEAGCELPHRDPRQRAPLRRPRPSVSGLLKTHKPRLIKKQTGESLSGISSLSALCPRTVCDVSLSRVCGGKQKEVGSTGPAGACQLLGCLLLIKENRNRSLSWHKMWNLIFFAVPSSSSVCTDRDLDVSSDRSLIFPLSVATELRLMDPSSETMWGSCGRKGKTTFFFPVFN